MTTITMQIYIYINSAWTDVTSDTFDNDGYSASWGMSSNKPTDFVAKTGTMNFTLKNNDGKYLPNGSAVVSPDWGKGVKVKAVFTSNGISSIRFYGVVDKLDIVKIPPDISRVRVSCVDWMNYAAKFPLQNPAIQIDKRMDEAMTTIVDAMAIQPLARDFAEGLNVFPTVFNDATQFTFALSEFSKLATSELGYIYVKKDATYGETLVAESAGSRVLSTPRKKVKVSQGTSYLLQENGSYLLQENGSKLLLGGYTFQDVSVDNSMDNIQADYGENLINRIVVSVNPTKIADKDSLLYSLESPIYFEAGAEKEFNVQFTEESSKRIVAALPPESSYPTSLFHFDDTPSTGGAIKDESGKTWNDFGVELVANVKKFGARSMYMDGSDTYVYASTSDSFEFGSGDFTVEWWEYRFSAASTHAVIRRSTVGTYLPWSFGVSDGTNSKAYISSNGSSYDIANGKTWGAIALNTWVKYSISRVGNTFYMHKDGLLTDTWTSSAAILASTDELYIGGVGTCITACIDELRITKGLGRYTANYTPETEPFSLSGLVVGAWNNENGEGTELTEDFAVTVSYGAAGATINVTNNSTYAGWLTDLKVFGKIVESTSKLSNVQEDADSISQYSEHELVIDQIYQQDFTSGREEAAKILETNKNPLVRVNSVSMNANRSESHAQYFLGTDVGDVVQIVEPVTETDADFFIQGMNWSAQAGNDGVIVNFGWTLKKFRESLSELAIKFAGAEVAGELNSVHFGYLPAVSADNVPYRIWSLWFYKGLTRSGSTFIYSYQEGSTTYRGYGVGLVGANGRVRVVIKNGTVRNIYDSQPGFVPNVNNTWHHLLVAADVNSTNYPKMYWNGVLETNPTLVSSIETGESTEVGTNLLITDSQLSSACTMADVRIYNGDQIADPSALALALYNEGRYGENNKTGLLFRTFYVPANELSDYEGVSLTEDMKVYDDVGFAVGTPTDTPLGVAI